MQPGSFSVGLRQNLSGEEDGEVARVKEVLRIMGLEEQVQGMYGGVDSCLYRDYDEKGVLISGGEAQKLAIARALYKDASILIMDEPTAALDPVSEAELYGKINTVMKEKTMLFISHRLSSCCFCDRILVLEEGRVVEAGCHEELLARQGVYQSLWEAQARHYQFAAESNGKTTVIK